MIQRGEERESKRRYQLDEKEEERRLNENETRKVIPGRGKVQTRSEIIGEEQEDKHQSMSDFKEVYYSILMMKMILILLLMNKLMY